MSETFRDVGAQLAANGYKPVPIKPGTKAPPMNGRQKYRLNEADLGRYASHGAGILCGDVIGIDIDVRDEDFAARLEQLAEKVLGRAPRRIGRAPKVLRLHRADRPFAKLQTRGYRLRGDEPDAQAHKIEILATGQQFVAFGEHPETKRHQGLRAPPGTHAAVADGDRCGMGMA